MSIELIIGSSGAGKTSYLYNNVVKEAKENPCKNYIIVVPEQFTLETQSELVMNYTKCGIMNIDVLSFGRLAHRIFSELGCSFEGVLDDEGKNLLLRKMATKLEGDKKLPIFGSHLKKIGYISEIKSVISEFSQYNIKSEDMDEIIENLADKNLLSYKLKEIERLYQEFETYLGDKYITGEELLKKLSRVVECSEILKNSVITFDGFTGFTPVQYELIKELTKVSNEVRATITLDQISSKEIFYTSPYELFAMGKEMFHKLSEIANVCNVPLKLIDLNEKIQDKRYSTNQEMSFLEENIFRYSSEKYDGVNNIISIDTHKSVEDECRWLANNIRNLVKEEGYRYRDIVVIVGNIEGYTPFINRAMNELDIPIFSDQKRSLFLNSLIEYIRSLLLMIEKDFPYEETFRFLKSGVGVTNEFTKQDKSIQVKPKAYGIFTRNTVDLLENYALKYGVKGFAKWEKAFHVKFLEEYRLEFLADIRELKNQIEKVSTVKDITKAIYLYMVKHNIEDKILEKASYFESCGSYHLEKEYSQIYKVLIELFDKFVDILGDEKVNLKEYMELLDAGLMEARVGVVPQNIDSVLVGDLKRTRTGNVKLMFYIGLNDDVIPGKLGSKGILSDKDRETLGKQGIRLKPDGKEQMYLQKYYLYMTLTKPTDKLFLSYSDMNVGNKEVRPCYLINEIKKLYPNIKVNTSRVAEMYSVNSAIEFLIKGFQNIEIQEKDDWIKIYNWFLQNEQYKHIIELLEQSYFYERNDQRLSVKHCKTLYGEQLRNSVSRLEKYAMCPYSHFLNYGLELKDRDTYEFKSSDIGNILHLALDKYGRKVEQFLASDVAIGYVEGRVTGSWQDIKDTEKLLWAKECLQEAVREDVSYELLNENARDLYAINRMQRILDRIIWGTSKQLEGGNFKPDSFELSFGFEGDLLDGMVPLNEEVTMQLRGKIDRVDVCDIGISEEKSKILKIVDYKTGAKDFSLSSLYDGVQLQLFVYLMETMKLYKKQVNENESIETKFGGVFYSQVHDPIMKKGANEQYQAQILSNLKPDGMLNTEYLGIFDENFIGLGPTDGYTSNIIPAKKAKTKPSVEGKALITENDVDNICNYTEGKIKELGNRIISGDISIDPYADKSQVNACTYCSFKRICGFDLGICQKGSKNYAYREASNYEKEQILEELEGLYSKERCENIMEEISEVNNKEVE